MRQRLIGNVLLDTEDVIKHIISFVPPHPTAELIGNFYKTVLSNTNFWEALSFLGGTFPQYPEPARMLLYSIVEHGFMELRKSGLTFNLLNLSHGRRSAMRIVVQNLSLTSNNLGRSLCFHWAHQVECLCEIDTQTYDVPDSIDQYDDYLLNEYADMSINQDTPSSRSITPRRLFF